MYEAFTNAFAADPQNEAATHDNNLWLATVPVEQQELISRFGGKSFNNGIYRILGSDALAGWQERLTKAFPEATDRAQCFGMDWLGRLFASDRLRQVDNAPGVLMFEPGTGQVLQIPANLVGFHDHELLNAPDAALAKPFYDEWLASGGAAPRYAECIGYQRPVFMNGKDDITNLARIDTAVYWGICARFIQAVRALPPGTPVDHLSV